MMSLNNLNIYLPELKKGYGFYYYFNNDSSFDDLLESFSYNFPKLRICPCYKIKIYNDCNKTYFPVDMKEKVTNYFKSYSQYQLIREKNKCTCDKFVKNFFWTPKLEIISKMKDYMRAMNKLELIISHYKSKEKKIWEQDELLKQQFSNLKYENYALKNENKEINELKQKIENIEKKEIDKEKQIEKLTHENEKLAEENLESEKTNKEANFIDFYDVIVDIKSVKDISEGWKIKMNENARKKYEEFKKENVIKIGVIGNANKGKSFLLSKISKIPLPSGTSIRTEGLSIKYPVLDKYKNRKIVLLDSAGLETPVLKSENKLAKITENDIKEKEHFKEKCREKIYTELFLQNYIINNSDILIIVVGILTYSEQKLLNRIRTKFLKSRNNKNNDQKPLFIIHNLMTYKTINQVEEYINDLLLKSATFDLAIGHKISTKEEEKEGTYFYEKILNQRIFHLIYAKEGSSAGNYYNNFTLDFLENSYQNVINLTNFDVIETIKDNFIEISQDILEIVGNPISKESFESSNNNLIKLLPNANDVILKKYLIDEFDFFILKGDEFQPTYSCYKKGDKIIVRVEVSGNKDISATIEHNSIYNIIKVNGNKRKDKEPEKNEGFIFSNREFGHFSFDIPLNPDYCLKNAQPKISEKKGLIIIEFELEEMQKEGFLEEIEEEDV